MKPRPRSILLFPGDAQWTSGDTTVDAPTPSAAVEALRLPPKSSLTLAIPSHWCLCATIDAPTSTRRQSLVFQLETELPLAAEDFVADFLPIVPDRSLGIAAQLRRLQPVVHALEQAGHSVDSVTPAALLAAQTYLPSLPDCDALLFPHAGRLELLTLSAGQITQWDTIPLAPEDALRELGLRTILAGQPLRLACANLPPEIAAFLADLPNLTLLPLTLPDATTAASQSAATPPPVELRRDALGQLDPYRPARRSINAAVAASLLLTGCICAGLLWRAHHYNRLAADYDLQQSAAYAQAFNGNAPPPGINIPSRLASEERRLRALSGDAGTADLPARTSALLVLQRLLARLPDGALANLDDLRINNDRVALSGTAPSHGHAAALSQSLSADSAFRLDAPRTEQLPSGAGVNLTLTGVASLSPPHAPTRKEATP